MCFVFGINVYCKLFLHVFHAYQCNCPIGPFVQLMMMMRVTGGQINLL